MIKSAGNLMLVLKRLPGGFTAGESRTQNLQSDVDAQCDVVRTPHFSVAAFGTRASGLDR